MLDYALMLTDTLILCRHNVYTLPYFQCVPNRETHLSTRGHVLELVGGWTATHSGPQVHPEKHPCVRQSHAMGTADSQHEASFSCESSMAHWNQSLGFKTETCWHFSSGHQH